MPQSYLPISTLLFFYDLPNWLMGLLIVSFTILISVLGFFVSRALFPKEFAEETRGTFLEMVSVLATINSLLLAFSAVSVWNSYDAADKAVFDEANTASQLGRDLAVYNTKESINVREQLKDYLKSVIDREWPHMARGESCPDTREVFNRMFNEVGTIELTNTKQQIILTEIWARINELTKYRRLRLRTSESTVPDVLWGVVILGTVFTFLLLYALPRNRSSIFLVTMVGASFGLVFYFIVAMDRPFAGEVSIDKGPFEQTIRGMETWDQMYPHVAPGKKK